MYCIVCNEWEAEETPIDVNKYEDSQGREFALIHTSCSCKNCRHVWDRWYHAIITDSYDSDIRSVLHYND